MCRALGELYDANHSPRAFRPIFAFCNPICERWRRTRPAIWGNAYLNAYVAGFNPFGRRGGAYYFGGGGVVDGVEVGQWRKTAKKTTKNNDDDTSRAHIICLIIHCITCRRYNIDLEDLHFRFGYRDKIARDFDSDTIDLYANRHVSSGIEIAAVSSVTMTIHIIP